MFTFLWLIFSSNVQAIDSNVVTLQPALYPIESVIENKAFELSKTEVSLSHDLVEAFKKLKVQSIHMPAMINLEQKVSKSKMYAPFNAWIDSIKVIGSFSNVAQALEYCEKIEKPTHKDKLEVKLQSHLMHLCHRQALDISSNNIKNNGLYPKNVNSYILDHLEYFLNSTNSEHFYRFVTKLSAFKAPFNEFSKEVGNHIINKNLTPTPELLEKIEIGPELTRYIQLKGLASIESKKIFQLELKDMVNAIYRNYEDKTSNKNFKAEVNTILNFVEINKSYLPEESAYNSVLSVGRYFMRRNSYEEARLAFNYVMLNTRGEQKDEAIFQYLWTYLNDHNFSEAHKFMLAHDLLTNFDYLDSRIQFWIAYTLMKTGDNSSAISYFKKLIHNHPLSYYGIMATKNIQQIKNLNNNNENFYVTEVNLSASGIILSPKELSPLAISRIKRIKAWGQIDYAPFIESDYLGLVESDPKTVLNPEIDYDENYLRNNLAIIVSSVLGRENNYVAGFKIIYEELERKNLSLSKNVLHALFPKPYFATVRNIASGTVDPIILLSLIRQESAFNPFAQSRVGARGLMQLMPATARTIERKVKDASLNNPETNINIGSRYFQYLYEKYEGNLVYTLSAYNAGESRVTKWRADYFKSDSILHNIENVPFEETRKYVKLIFRNIFFYKLMHEDLKTVDSSQPNEIYDIMLGFRR
ncbi:MAG: lytic transglycosylase domain-containing protein [Bacteriovoracaceae bacterium]|nr:lytic transglycosylase domain-containing protein [Bacteriovoracaceae bacterium]